MAAPASLDGAAPPRRSPFSRRALWHTLGIVLAALMTWLVWRGYRQPGMLLDVVNLTLC